MPLSEPNASAARQSETAPAEPDREQAETDAREAARTMAIAAQATGPQFCPFEFLTDIDRIEATATNMRRQAAARHRTSR